MTPLIKRLMMLKVTRYYTLITLLSVFFLFTNSFAAGYPGFREVMDNECVVLGEKDIQKLPPEWHKYKGFIKSCALKKNSASKANISIISIWSHDYLDAQNKDTWEEFPLPIIVDNHFNQCGTFPELYPESYVNSLYVYYGKWKAGIPTEIRIDVADPTVFGDYYYAPLIWNAKGGQYDMKTKGKKHGKRPK
jgi:hypothetical protein